MLFPLVLRDGAVVPFLLLPGGAVWPPPTDGGLPRPPLGGVAFSFSREGGYPLSSSFSGGAVILLLWVVLPSPSPVSGCCFPFPLPLRGAAFLRLPGWVPPFPFFSDMT